MRIQSSIAALLCGAVVLTGCTDPTFNPNDPYGRTRTGAFAGATAGAIIGAATAGGNTAKSAATGALIGGIGGAIVGNVLDRQAQELQASITTSGVRVVNQGDRLVVVMPEGILFATNSASVNPAIYGDLNAVAQNLNRYPNSKVQVVGHTDNTGTAALNADLSVRRANAVVSVLRGAGVASTRLFPVGMGETQPIASNLTPEGRAQNRRVEIIIIPTN